jgi:Asp-tRNA(Asn)/Glu-tRNA(Gln) amidotransferase C subunit
LLIKYGLYIRKKSSQLIERLESWENIDKQELDKYIGQFSWYLEKLNNLNTIPTTENEISQNLSEPTWWQTTDRQQSWTDQQIQSEQIDQIQNLPQTQ